MLYTFITTTDRLRAVTHINGSARLQTVTERSNPELHALLSAFKMRTGYGVLCNTSLNFKGKGFINDIGDLDVYTREHGLDGFVAGGRIHLLKSSPSYATYLRRSRNRSARGAQGMAG
jgi:predicted NodU family carbamoyl transferase